MDKNLTFYFTPFCSVCRSKQTQVRLEKCPQKALVSCGQQLSENLHYLCFLKFYYFLHFLKKNQMKMMISVVAFVLPIVVSKGWQLFQIRAVTQPNELKFPAKGQFGRRKHYPLFRKDLISK